MEHRGMNAENALERLAWLLAMARQDGALGEAEWQLIALRAREWNVPLEKLAEMVFAPITPNFHALQLTEKAELMADLVLILVADGIVHPDELALCKKVGASVGMSEREVQRIVEEALALQQNFGGVV